MTHIPDILSDKRTIKRIITVLDHGESYEVSSLAGGITKIEPYEEHGWGSMVTWFAVYVGDKIRYRVPAAAMIVEYAPDEDGAQ